MPDPLPSCISICSVLLTESGWAPFTVSKPGEFPGAMMPSLVNGPVKFKVPKPLIMPVFVALISNVVVPVALLLKRVPALLNETMQQPLFITSLPVISMVPVALLLKMPKLLMVMLPASHVKFPLLVSTPLFTFDRPVVVLEETVPS